MSVFARELVDCTRRPSSSARPVLFNPSGRGGDTLFYPSPSFLQPLFVRGSVDIPLVLKDAGLLGESHKLDCRDSVLQDDAGALHPPAAIHLLTPNHHFLSIGRQWGQRSHVNDHAEWSVAPCENLVALLVPLLKLRFSYFAAKGEIKSQIGLVYFVHRPTLLIASDYPAHRLRSPSCSSCRSLRQGYGRRGDQHPTSLLFYPGIDKSPALE